MSYNFFDGLRLESFIVLTAGSICLRPLCLVRVQQKGNRRALYHGKTWIGAAHITMRKKSDSLCMVGLRIVDASWHMCWIARRQVCCCILDPCYILAFLV